MKNHQSARFRITSYNVCYTKLLRSLLLFISDNVRHTRVNEDGEKVEIKGKKMKSMRVTDALVIGCMQGVGVLPGVSRSGSTISGALFSGLSRKTAVV